MIAVWLAACGEDPAPPPLDPPTGTIGTGPTVPVPEDGASRPWRRMNVDQLKASLEAVSGGIVWEEDGAAALDTLAPTLGKPDYAQSTREDLTPTLLFQKFLDDAATWTCDELLEREALGATAPVFLVYAGLGDTFTTAPDAVNENLAHLVLRFHGRSVGPDAIELEPWRFLFESSLVVGGEDTKAAWKAVCTALVTHPDFYMY